MVPAGKNYNDIHINPKVNERTENGRTAKQY
jgi:hypothetical protein